VFGILPPANVNGIFSQSEAELATLIKGGRTNIMALLSVKNIYMCVCFSNFFNVFIHVVSIFY
jgi:hypothetical protein